MDELFSAPVAEAGVPGADWGKGGRSAGSSSVSRC